jgi:hypothetical protein
MTTVVPDDAEILRLADDVRAKILAKRELIAVAEGEIMVRVFRKASGYDIKLTVTTR